jgi:hypothetical protein
LLLTTTGVIITVVAIVLATVGGVLFVRGARGPAGGSEVRTHRAKASLRFLTLLGVTIAIGLTIALLHAIAG